jgi:hypothetical protein
MIAAVALTGIAIVYARKKRRQRIVVTIGEDVVGKLGRDKYLGGEVGKNGSIYCVPYVYFLSFTHMLTHTHTHTRRGTAKYVLRIDPKTSKCETIGPFLSDVVSTSLRRNEFKWLRAICDQNGVLWGLPANANRVIKITPSIDPKDDDKIEFVGPKLYPGVSARTSLSPSSRAFRSRLTHALDSLPAHTHSFVSLTHSTYRKFGSIMALNWHRMVRYMQFLATHLVCCVWTPKRAK